MSKHKTAENVVALDVSKPPSGEYADVFEKLRKTPCIEDDEPATDESEALSHEPCGRAVQHGGSKADKGALLDHRKSSFQDGMTQVVKPPVCGLASKQVSKPPAVMTREALMPHLIPDIKKFVHELETTLGAIRERTGNKCDSIPILVRVLSLTREWFPNFEIPQVRKHFLSHAMLLQCLLQYAVLHAAASTSNDCDHVRDLENAQKHVTVWVDTLTPLD